MIDFDVVLEKVGKIGTYQIGVFAILAYTGIPSGLNSIAPVFLAYTPDFRCNMGPLDNSSLYPDLTETMILNTTTSLDGEGEPVDECVRYGYDLEECEDGLSCVKKSAPTIACDQGYLYDEGLFTETIVTEFDLVCDQRILNIVASSSFMAGELLGSLVGGIVADKIGRKVTVAVSTYGFMLMMLAISFVHTLELYSTCRFFLATFVTACRLVIFVHVMEIVGSKWRTLFGLGSQMNYIIGYLQWSWIAYVWRDWHQMAFAAFVLSSPTFIVVLFAPESPRWLFATGRNKKGKEVAAMMAKYNKAELGSSIWSEAEKSEEEEKNLDKAKVTYSTIDLFRHPNLRICTLKIAFNWAVNSMVYYGIALNAGSLSGDIFVNNALAGVLEMASYAFCALTMDYIGRRLLLTITLTGAGVCLIAITIANEYVAGSDALDTFVVVFALAGRTLVSGSFAIVYNFTSELYPTVVRTNAVGFGSTCARVGSILSPFILGIQDYVTWVPNAIFGSFAIVVGLMSLTLRDTTGRPMMETLEDAELFHAGKSGEKRGADATIVYNAALEVDEVDFVTEF